MLDMFNGSITQWCVPLCVPKQYMGADIAAVLLEVSKAPCICPENSSSVLFHLGR